MRRRVERRSGLLPEVRQADGKNTCRSRRRDVRSSPTPAGPPYQGGEDRGRLRGIAHYLNIDVTLVRVVWLLLVLCAGTGLLAYIILWIIMPKDYGK
jgi:phage shock protein PspC (stress-responsive transcriptional regulator)